MFPDLLCRLKADMGLRFLVGYYHAMVWAQATVAFIYINECTSV